MSSPTLNRAAAAFTDHGDDNACVPDRCWYLLCVAAKITRVRLAVKMAADDPFLDTQTYTATPLSVAAAGSTLASPMPVSQILAWYTYSLRLVSLGEELDWRNPYI